MSKSKRLMELIMTVNRKRKFTVKELAQEFEVSQRTILRDLQVLSELGVPLYSEVGPHGGYQVLKKRILPPIAFTEEEAIAIFFAIHALRHYKSLPFETETSSALRKFYNYMTEDVQFRIDQMKNRVDFVTPMRQAGSPYLSILLDASIHQTVLRIDYESRERRSNQEIQPIGIYTKNGFWYCPAYSFHRCDFRVFRCDRIHSVIHTDSNPMDLRQINLETRRSILENKQEAISLFVELSKEGVQMCEAEIWATPLLNTRKDGTGWLEGSLPKSEIPYLAKYFISLGKESVVQNPLELVAYIKQQLSEIMAQYV